MAAPFGLINNQISNAISAGTTAVTSTISTYTTVADSSMAVADSVFDTIGYCFGITAEEIKAWIIAKIKAWWKNRGSGKPWKVPPWLQAVIKFFKTAYKTVMGVISEIKRYLNLILQTIRDAIAWVDRKIQVIRDFINNPCVRFLISALPADAQNRVDAVTNIVTADIPINVPESF